MAKTKADKWLTVVPAYGRDYKTVDEVVKAWVKERRDFLIQDVSSKWNGKYVNGNVCQEYPAEKDTTFKVRFNGKADFVLIKHDQVVGSSQDEAQEVEGRR